MTKSREKELINQALASKNPYKETTDACREILVERLRDTEMNDRQIRIALENIVKQMVFPLQMEYQANKEEPTDRNALVKRKVPSWVLLLALVSIILILFTPILLRLLGALLLVGIATFSLMGTRTATVCPDESQNNTEAGNMVVTTTVDDILETLDALFDSMSPLFEFNQLDGRYSHVLEWIQFMYSRCDENVKEEIKELVGDIGYELIQYDKSLGDFFAMCKANVPETVTTKHAVRNRKTGKFIRNGTVCFPMS